MLDYLSKKGWKTLNADDTEQANIYPIVHWAKRLSVEKLLTFLPASWNSFKYLWEYFCFPYKEDLINEWFVQRFPSQDGEEKKAVNIINVDRDGRRTKSNTKGQTANFPEVLANGQFEVYFHGTDSGGGKGIIENGINLGRGDQLRTLATVMVLMPPKISMKPIHGQTANFQREQLYLFIA